MSIKRKIAIYAASFALVTGVIFYLIIFPTIKDIQKINNDVLAERVDLEKKYQRGQLLKKTIQNFQQIQPEEEKLDKIYIVEGNELEFITTLENIANKYTLTQTIGLGDQPVALASGLETLSLRITTNGEFINILKYLKEIERLPNYFNISTLTIAKTDANQLTNPEITINLQGQIFMIDKTQDDAKKSL